MKNLYKSIRVHQLFLIALSSLFFLFQCAESPKGLLKKRVSNVLTEVESYQFGSSRAWLQEFQDVMAGVNNMPEVQKDVERMMVKVLKSEASAESKLVICKFIGQVGSAYCIPVLQEMMLDSSTQHMVIIALASLPGDDISKILIESLEAVDPAGKVAIANALSLKPDKAAIGPLQTLLEENDVVIKLAAAHAISAIGGVEAAEILKNEFNTTKGEIKWKMAAYWLISLNAEPAQAKLEACENIFDSAPPLSVQYMALKMKLGSLPEVEQVVVLMDAFNNEDEEVQEMLVPLVRQLPANADLSVLIQSINKYPTEIQHQLMVAIADRNDPTIRPVLLAELKKTSADGRVMALRGLKNVANPQDLEVLVRIAATGTTDEQELARSCIYWMNDDNADSIILANAAIKNGDEKAELLMAIGYRKIVDGKELIFANMQNPDSAIRSAAIQALAKTGTYNDLEPTLDLLITKTNPADHEAIKNALISMAVNSQPEIASVEILTAKLTTQPGVIASVILVGVLGDLGSDAALETLRRYVDAADADVQYAVLKAMAYWKDDRPLTDLEEVLKKPIVQANRSQAIVGMVILTQNSKALSPDLKVEKLEQVYAAATNTFDKQTLINGVSRIYSIKALDFVISQVNQEDVKQVAQEATIRVAGDLRDGFHEEVKAKMEALLKKNEDSIFSDRIRTVIKSMQL